MSDIGSLASKGDSVEYRCPYCEFIQPQRSWVYDHVRAVHQRQLHEEERGFETAAMRMENLARRGTRIFGQQRLDSALEPLEPELSTRQMGLVRKAVVKILAMGLVFVGDETYNAGRRYSMLKRTYDEMNR
jgi:hypothetical protein